MRMKHEPSEETVTAWARLVRAEQTVLGRIEAALKAADLPPLSWYDVLLELGRAEDGRLRPLELERRTLLAQYNASRLIDRMEKEIARNRGVLAAEELAEYEQALNIYQKLETTARN